MFCHIPQTQSVELLTRGVAARCFLVEFTGMPALIERRVCQACQSLNCRPWRAFSSRCDDWISRYIPDQLIGSYHLEGHHLPGTQKTRGAFGSYLDASPCRRFAITCRCFLCLAAEVEWRWPTPCGRTGAYRICSCVRTNWGTQAWCVGAMLLLTFFIYS